MAITETVHTYIRSPVLICQANLHLQQVTLGHGCPTTYGTLGHGCSTIYGKGPHVLSWAASRAACGKMAVTGIPNCLNYCVIFVVYK